LPPYLRLEEAKVPSSNKKLMKSPAKTGKRPVTGRRDLEQGVLTKLRVVFSSAKKHFYEVETRCGVSGAQLWTLIELQENSGLRVSDLAQLLSIRNSTASNMLDKLELRGLIRRERNDKDQRVVRLFLTPEGSRVVEMAPKPARGVVPDALSHIALPMLDRLDASLGELISHLKIKDAQAVLKPLSDI
jgi:DNA-binding MarR family transcriptional regulator